MDLIKPTLKKQDLDNKIKNNKFCNREKDLQFGGSRSICDACYYLFIGKRSNMVGCTRMHDYAVFKPFVEYIREIL
jgi:hypothetical protein